MTAPFKIRECQRTPGEIQMRLYSSELGNQNAHPNETEERSRQGVGLPQHKNTDQYTDTVKKRLFANTANTILGPTGFVEYHVNAANAAHEEQEETDSMVKLHCFI
jgi:hypothetical protein